MVRFRPVLVAAGTAKIVACGVARPLLILGPTAGGKTALALALAQALPGGGECICADSMQVYRGMDIGTAKPTAEQRRLVPHHLLDLLDPSEDGFTVDAWLALADAAMAGVEARCHSAIVVGGTNLYVQALLQGLFEGPGPDRALRAELDALDPGHLRQRLSAVDPEAARRLHPNDRRRAIRAIEVHAATGRPLSALQTQWDAGPRRELRIIGLQFGREAINRRINARVRAMVDAGLVEEARSLWAARSLGSQASEALGYKQLIECFEGRMCLEDAIEQIKIQTRRFARRQGNWLRRFRRHVGAIWIAADDLSPENLAQQAFAAISGDGLPAGPMVES